MSSPGRPAPPRPPEAGPGLTELMDAAAAMVGAHRTAVQDRSREKLQRVLTTTMQLLEEGGPDAVSTTAVAAAAGVSVGWIYTFFESREALLEEILVIGLRDLDRRLAEVDFTLSGEDWREKAEAGVQAHVEFFAALPWFRALWFSTEFSGRMIQANRLHDTALAAFLEASITAVRPDAPDVPLRVVTQVFVGMLDKGVDLAYREDPLGGDAAVLDEVKRSSIAYLEAFLG